jgi:RHS repeat-associated protein
VGGNTLLFTYDGWNPIMEWDSAGNWRGWTIYGAKADEVLLRYDTSYGPLLYKHDNQGNVTFILDGGGRTIEKYTYDVYGRPTVTSWDYNTWSWKAPSDRSSFGNRYMFTGREWLADVQLYDYRNRLYNPDTGRFMQKDPLGFEAGDSNLFRYCGGDPVNHSDPMGTDIWNPSMSDKTHMFEGPFWDVIFDQMQQVMASQLFARGEARVSASVHIQPVQPEPQTYHYEGHDHNTNGTAINWQTPSLSAGGYWSYSNYEARHEASMANSNFSSTMAPFWDPGNVNDTGTTGDEGHTIYYPNAGTPMGHAEDGVVTPTGGTFQGGRRDPRWVFPSQAESARLGLSFVQNADKYNQWLIAHNQWYYGNKGH